jgi:hypothetical protein
MLGKNFIALSVLASLVCLAPLPALAQTGGACSGDQREKPGEPIDARFMGIPYIITGHILAEKYCGAKAASMKSKILGYIEKNGCGPNSDVYMAAETTISKAESDDLKQFAGDQTNNAAMSAHDAQRWAAATVNKLGGCSNLIKLHDEDELEGATN